MNVTFSLTPLTNAILTTTTDITTQTGGIRVRLDWEPSQLNAGNKTELTLDFSDSAYGGSLNANVKYDLSITGNNGTNVVFDKTSLIAIQGMDQQSIKFPEDGIYRVHIKVKELDRTGQVPDWTRNGIARGVVVVPEFGSLAVLIAAAAVASTIIAARYSANKLRE
jgi:predicted secreted protein with PEFG-CTERM motif